MITRNSYIVGDIQGCAEGLNALLKKVSFDPATDRLFAVGDLVARGEDSLATVELLMGLGDRFQAVLGNHDLHLLAATQGIRKVKKNDRMDKLLNAQKLPEIIHWLRQFPLAYQIDQDHVMVHAGLYPLWSVDKLLALSDEISLALKGDDWISMLKNMYGNSPTRWKESLKGNDRARFIINACTRMRFLKADQSLEFDAKGSPMDSPSNLIPWFQCPNQLLKNHEKVVFGHWAALNGKTRNQQFIGLDTGYVWGQTMTVLHLESGERISVSA